MSTDPSPSATAAPRHHFSLRELFLLIAWAAIGCAALKTANGVWWTVLSTIMLALIMVMAVVAAVDRGHRQAFAVGSLICVLIYAALIVFNHNANAQYSRELDPYDGSMPTTKLMFPLFEAMVTRTEVPIATPWGQSGSLMPLGSPPPYATTTWSEAPDRTAFMRVAHAFWALLLGYVGGRFGQRTYERRAAISATGR